MRKLTKGNIDAAADIRRLPQLASWDDADKGFALLRSRFPSNTNRAHVLVKASAIDKLYSTRAGNIYWVADAVIEAADEIGRHVTGDQESMIRIVDAISRHKLRAHPGSDRCASFASKYCYFFVGEGECDFPLFDSYARKSVEDLLDIRLLGKRHARGEYGEFCDRLSEVRANGDLKSVGVREMDRFLWLWGQWRAHLASRGKKTRVRLKDDVRPLFYSRDPGVRALIRALLQL